MNFDTYMSIQMSYCEKYSITLKKKKPNCKNLVDAKIIKTITFDPIYILYLFQNV